MKSTENLSGKFDDEIDFGIVKCRIVITPNNDTDIKWYEINGYAKQLVIEVDKEQNNNLVSENLFSFGHAGNLTDTLGVYGDSDWQSSSAEIDISCCSKIVIIGEDFSSTSYSLYDVSGSRVVDVTISTDSILTDEDGLKYIEILTSNYDTATTFQLCYKSDATFDVLLYA